MQAPMQASQLMQPPKLPTNQAEVINKIKSPIAHILNTQ